MKLSHRLLSLGVLVSLGYFLLAVVALETFVVRGFGVVETTQARRNLERCRDALERTVRDLGTNCRDYAHWDLMFDYVLSRDPSFVEANLSEDVYTNLDLDLLRIMDGEGREIYRHDGSSGRIGDAPAWEVEFARKAARGEVAVGDSLEGIVSVGRDLVLTATYPIRDTALARTPRGVLTFARILTGERLKRVSDLVHLPFTVTLLEGGEKRDLPADLDPATGRLLRVRDRDNLDAYALLDDLRGRPTALLHLTLPREVMATGHSVLRYSLLTILGGMGAILLALVLITRFYLIRHVRGMMGAVMALGQGREGAPLVPVGGPEEIRLLAMEFNHLIQRNREIRGELESLLADRSSKLDKAGDALRLAGRVFDNLRESICITDAAGVILQVNPAFREVTGFSPEDAVGQRASILKSNRHEPEFYHQMWETLLANGFWQGEIWNRRKDGAVYPAFLSIISLRNEAGETTHHIGSLQDISFMKASEERIRYLAYHDPLTGLPNRLLFVDRLNLAIQQAKRDGTKLAVIILDLDGFKKVNDTLGHPVGDLLLVEVARRLSENIRAEDTVARLGGDEFIILLPRIRQEEAVLLVVRKVLSWLGRPMELKGHELVVSASLGVSLYPGDGTTYEDLLKAADIAMYRVKESGKSGYQIYSREMDQIMRRRVELENRLRQALARKEFRLFYQPRHDLRTGQIRGAEALVRWVQPEGIIPPQDFIPIAEETGLILPLGEWILTEACRQARAWSRLRDGDMAVSVNISPFQIRRPEFGPEVERILAETGADPRCLEMEITEGIFIHDFVEVARTIARLNGLGIRFSLDDFGTGYSSLYYLKRLPIQTLKIDRSFISDLEHSEDSRVIIDTILSMAEILNLDFVAEGVETRFQAEYFAARNRRGTGQGQGFLFSRPQPPAELEALLGLAPPPPSS